MQQRTLIVLEKIEIKHCVYFVTRLMLTLKIMYDVY